VQINEPIPTGEIRPFERPERADRRATCSFGLNRKGEVTEWIEGQLPYFLEACFIDHQNLPQIEKILTGKARDGVRAYLSVAEGHSASYVLEDTALKIRTEISRYSLSIRPFFADGKEHFICTIHPRSAASVNGLFQVVPGEPEVRRRNRSANTGPSGVGDGAVSEMASGKGSQERSPTLEVMAELNQLYAQTLSELNRSYDFLNHVQYYAQVGHLLFDRQLRLRKFVPEVGNYAGVSPYDIGKGLSEVLHAFDSEVAQRLYALAHRVLEEEQTESRIVPDKIGQAFRAQLRPYRNPGEFSMGVILTLTHVDGIVETEPLPTAQQGPMDLFFESSPDICLVFDARGYILKCNRRFRQVLGYRSIKDVVGKHLSDFSAPNNTYKVEEKLKLLRNGVSVVGLQKVVCGKKGRLIPVEVHANPVRDERGKTIAYLGVWRDMRELRRAEDTASTLLTAFPNSTDDFWDWDMKRGVFVSCHTLEEWLGYAPEELPNTALSWYRLVDPMDIKGFKDSLRSHIRSRGRKPFAIEMKFRRKDGSTAYIHFRGRVVEWDREGRPLRMMGCQMDISYLRKVPELEKELDEKSRAFDEIMESTMAGYWDWDLENGVQFMSSTFKRMFGYSDREMPDKPESWQRIVHPEDLSTLWKNFELHIESGGEVPFENEIRFFHKQGHIVWVWCRGKVVEWDAQGQPLRMIGSHTDITRLKNLDQTNKELERFAYIASHDLQEPLRTIIDFGTLMEDEYGATLNEEAKMYLNFIKSSAQQMSTLVRDILIYSRSTGKTIKERIDLTDVYKKTLMNLFSVIDEKQARIEADSLPVVFGNETELLSLFMNLIGNALKFNKAGEPPVVRIAVEDTATHWKLRFTDNGIGIAEEDQGRIFEIFQRLHNREDYEGNGIGLAHCMRIARNHGGQIEVCSQENKGSTFIVSLIKSY